jgi:hypothetical protein
MNTDISPQIIVAVDSEDLSFATLEMLLFEESIPSDFDNELDESGNWPRHPYYKNAMYAVKGGVVMSTLGEDRGSDFLSTKCSRDLYVINGETYYLLRDVNVAREQAFSCPESESKHCSTAET